MHTILVTGGCGYIGSHTIVDLIENGYDVISIDNNSRSTTQLLEGAEKITGRKIINYSIDLCDFEATQKIFQKHRYTVSFILRLINRSASPLKILCCILKIILLP